MRTHYGPYSKIVLPYNARGSEKMLRFTHITFPKGFYQKQKVGNVFRFIEVSTTEALRVLISVTDNYIFRTLDNDLRFKPIYAESHEGHYRQVTKPPFSDWVELMLPTEEDFFVEGKQFRGPEKGTTKPPLYPKTNRRP